MLAAMQSGAFCEANAVRIGPDFRVWTGPGDLTLEGQTYLGIGLQGEIATGAAVGGAEQGLRLALSGLDPETDALSGLAALDGADVVVWELTLDPSFVTVLDAYPAERGRVDAAAIDQAEDGTLTVSVQVENASRGLGRATARTRSDADQALIGDTPTFHDQGFSEVATAPFVELYLGGQRPTRAGQALPGVYGGGGGAGELGDGYIS